LSISTDIVICPSSDILPKSIAILRRICILFRFSSSIFFVKSSRKSVKCSEKICADLGLIDWSLCIRQSILTVIFNFLEVYDIKQDLTNKFLNVFAIRYSTKRWHFIQNFTFKTPMLILRFAKRKVAHLVITQKVHLHGKFNKMSAPCVTPVLVNTPIMIESSLIQLKFFHSGSNLS